LDHNFKFVAQHLKAKKVALALRQLATVLEHLQPPLPWLPPPGGQPGVGGGGSSGREVEAALSQAMAAAMAEFAAADLELAARQQTDAQELPTDYSDALQGDGKALRWSAETHLALRQVGATRNAPQGRACSQRLFVCRRFFYF
jgi:hypothetical protein